MKTKFLTIVIICLGAMNLMGTDPGYHFQLDFTNESSDNIEGWTTNRRSEHPYGGVAVSSGGYARFRNAVAAMKTNSAFTYAGTLSFNLKPDSYGTNIASASGELFYELTASSRDTVFNIEAVLECEFTAVKGDISQDLTFYPNPASEKVVFGSGNELYNASIYDMTGRLLIEKKYKTEMDISFLKTCYYILQMQSGERKLSSQLIVY